MVGKFESNKDLVQELTASGAQRVGKIASLITGTVAEVAREIGVGEALLGPLCSDRTSPDGKEPPAALDTDEWAELERLRREVAELRMDRGRSRPPL